MKIVNYIERHNIGWNDFLTKSNRTEIQGHPVEGFCLAHAGYYLFYLKNCQPGA